MRILSEVGKRIRASSLLACTKSTSLFNSVKILLAPWWFPVAKVLHIQFPQFIFKLKNEDGIVTCTMWSDENFAAIYEIFYLKEYELKNNNPKIIFDIGANVGFASSYFATTYPQATIYAIEPDPTTYGRLKTQVHQFARIKPWCGAISATTGTLTFYSSKNSLSSSIQRRSPTDTKISVATVTIDSFAKKQKLTHIDLLKFDVEGAEWLMFQTKPKVQIKEFIGEYHEDLVKKPVSAFVKLFPNHDISVTQLYKSRFIIHGVHK